MGNVSQNNEQFKMEKMSKREREQCESHKEQCDKKSNVKWKRVMLVVRWKGCYKGFIIGVTWLSY